MVIEQAVSRDLPDVLALLAGHAREAHGHISA